MCKHAFPVRIVEHYHADIGTWRARRAAGVVVATGCYGFDAESRPTLTLTESDPPSADIRITSLACLSSLQQLFVRLKQPPFADKLLTQFAGSELSLAFVTGTEHLLSYDEQQDVLFIASDLVLPLGLAETDFLDPTAVWNERTQGWLLLLILGHYQLLLATQHCPERTALGKMLELYASFSSQERGYLQQILADPLLDSGQLFAEFLQRVSLNDQPAWQDQQITWLKGQDRLDLPYSRQAAQVILQTVTDVDSQRGKLYRLLQAYDKPLERLNITRIAAQTRQQGQQLIFGRMSRAFHNQATLFANAVLLQPMPEWRDLADELTAIAQQTPDLLASAATLSLLLNDSREIPLTQLEGSCERFEQAVLEHQQIALMAALRPSRARIEDHNDNLIPAFKADTSYQAILVPTGQSLQLVERIRQALLNAPKRHAAYVVISQRPSPTGSHLLIKINEFMDPYLGKAENLRKLVRLAGDRIYSSPDYGWLSEADHWIEAIPLFIKEEILVQDGQETTRTVIDIAGMEVSFREEMADLWAQNLAQVLESEFLWLARHYLSTGQFTEIDVPTQPVSDSTEIAALSVLLSEIYRQHITEVQTLIEAEEITPIQAYVQLLDSHSWLDDAQVLQKVSGHWHEAVQQILGAPDYRKDLTQEILRLTPLALTPLRALPTLHVLTTQSAGMTEGYIRTWLEESMALYNIATDYELHAQIAERERVYTTRIRSLGKHLIHELGLWLEVEELCAHEQLSESAAIHKLINRHKLLQSELACLGTLLEFAEWQNAKVTQDTEAEINAMTAYLQPFAQSLQETALNQFIEDNREILLQQSVTRAEPDLQQLALADASYRQEIAAISFSLARRQALADLAAKHPDWQVSTNCESYLRRYQHLRKTTARKAIIAELGLNPLSLHPQYYFKASGGGKRYHLIYTPSRVDLGHRERESVETWAQWIGGADRAAAQAGRQIYSLINKDVRTFNSLTEPEILKTGENASMATHFAFSNALSLMINASNYGDFEAMADLMNRRHDRYIHPAGEGYGGYCVPKDGLFLEFVLTLNRREKLRQIGLPEVYHVSVVRLANQLLDRKNEFSGQLEWEAWAAEQLQAQSCLKPYFSVSQGLPVFQITRIAHVLENLGKPEIRDHYRIGSTLAAGWGLHKMITGGEQVNRFMPFFKTWLIQQGIAEAARLQQNPAICLENSVVVLSAEYKPDTQDARFATGLRKLEILLGAGGHLLNALDSEGQMIALLLHQGYQAVVQRGWGARLLESLHIATHDAAQIVQLHKLYPPVLPPAEIRLVSPTGLSTQDLLTYTSDSRLEALAAETRCTLLQLGFAEAEISANLRSWGPRLQHWAIRPKQLAGLTAEARVSLNAGLNALALAELGPNRDYPYALQGADVIDTGIPHRSLLALLADPARLCRLMLTGNPNSALVIVDGGAGARHRAMNRDEVMLWFAAAERLGKQAVYLSIGVGRETVATWRKDMQRQRRRAQKLYQALCDPKPETAHAIYADIQQEMAQDQEISSTLAELDKLRRFGRENPRRQALSEILSRIGNGVTLAELNFCDFLALGGLYLFIGATPSEIAAAQTTFELAITTLAGQAPASNKPLLACLLDVDDSSAMVHSTDFREEKGVESSNKATEEHAIVAQETRQQLAERIAKANALKQRHASFSAVAVQDSQFAQHYQAAKHSLGSAEQLVSETVFGSFLGHTRNALLALCHEYPLQDHPEQSAEIVARFNQLFATPQIDESLYQQIAGGYEDIGDFGRLAQALRESAGLDTHAKLQGLQTITQGIELYTLILAINTTISLCQTNNPTPTDSLPLWRALASFFAKTINDHSYEYRPWLYSRGTGYIDYQGEALYELAEHHHQWLYAYLRNLVVHYTELSHLPNREQDLLLGNYLPDKLQSAIGAEAEGLAESFWRAYGQIRELAFIRNDGFPIPEVFAAFDPELIKHHSRVNHVFLAPVGRTHFSRALCEGPTLASELESKGQRGGNLIITRHLRIKKYPLHPQPIALIDSGHFYVNGETYAAALVQHKAYSPETAQQLAVERSTPKGIRVAACFSQPLLAALAYPFHGNPHYESGQLEDCGLPYTVQSLFHTWTTYDKTKYREIFRDSGVELPQETAWSSTDTARLADKATVKHAILHGLVDKGYPGLIAFAQMHPLVMIKDAAESGGRNAQAFSLVLPDGSLDQAQIQAAADFVYQISLRHPVCIQEVVLSSPEYWATESFIQAFVQRQIQEWGSAVNRLRHPHTRIYGSQRIILSCADLDEPDLQRKWHISHWISLNSKQLITNLGRGGTLEQLLPEFIQAEHRDTIIGRLSTAGRLVMQALSDYETQAASDYYRETGRRVGADLMGVSYGIPRYMMLDFIIAPIFDQAGLVSALEPLFDDDGQRIGSAYLLQQAGKTVTAKIVDWRVVLIEPNIGVGLWDRVTLREEYHERERARRESEAPDWQRIGVNARQVLRDLNQAGVEYLEMLQAGDGPVS